MRVVLEQKALEALASETRIALLKALIDRQQTVTQLAKVVGQDKAGVFRHLQKLSEGGLVEKDNGHGFTYYRLTVRGKSVISPTENVRIALLLGGAFTAMGIAYYGTIGFVSRPEVAESVRSLVSSPAVAGTTPGLGLAALLSLLCGVLGVVLSTYLLLRRLRPRRARLSPDEAREESTLGAAS